MKRRFYSLLSLVIILSMLLSCGGGINAFADETSPQTVTATGAETKSESVPDNLSVVGTGAVTAASVKAADGAEASLTVEGNDTVESSSGNATALSVEATNGAQASGEVQGNLEATAPSGTATGIQSLSLISGASADVQVTGNVSANGKTAVGVWDIVDTNASVDITVSGNVEATGNTYASGIDLPGFAGSPNPVANKTDVHVTGNVTAESNGAASGINVQSDGKTIASIVVDQNITASGAGSTSGVAVVAADGTADIKVSGNTSAEATGNAIARGTYLSSFELGNIQADVHSLSAESEDGLAIAAQTGTNATGTVQLNTHDSDLSAVSYNGQADGIASANYGTTVITTGEGDIRAEGKSAAGILADSWDGTLTITTHDVKAIADENNGIATGIHAGSYADGKTNTFAGDVEASGKITEGISLNSIDGALVYVTAEEVNATTSDSENGKATGAVLSASGTEEGPGANLKVEGDISADTVGVRLDARDKGGVYVTAKNITGGDVGLSFVQLDEDAHAFASVQEVLHGDDIGVLVNEHVTADNVEIAVWKIDTVTVDGENHVVLEENAVTGERSVTDRSRTVEQKIQYLIKVQEDQSDVIQQVDGAELWPFIEEGSIGAAAEGTKLTIRKVNLPDGCELTGAYNGVDGEKIELLKDADGSYYYVVPRGGGVILSVAWGKVSSGSADWYPEYVNGVDYVDVTFDYNGGHKPASLFAGPIVKTVPVGTYVVLVEPPVKEGAEFLGWVSDNENVTVSKPGQNFCATEPVLFTASWSDDPVQTTAERNTALAEAIAQSETLTIASEEEVAEQADSAVETSALSQGQESASEDAVPLEEETFSPATLSLAGTDVAFTLDGDNDAMLSLSDLLNVSGSNLSAKLVIDLGGGSALEIPVDIQLSLGTPVLVTPDS